MQHRPVVLALFSNFVEHVGVRPPAATPKSAPSRLADQLKKISEVPDLVRSLSGPSTVRTTRASPEDWEMLQAVLRRPTAQLPESYSLLCSFVLKSCSMERLLYLVAIEKYSRDYHLLPPIWMD